MASLGPRRDIVTARAAPCEEANRGIVGLQDLTPSALPVHSDNDVVESAWRVDAGFAWHAVSRAEHDRVGKLYFYGRPPFASH